MATAGTDVRTLTRRIAVVLGFVAYNLWDEALFSTPVVAAAAALGPWPAFVGFSLLYGVGGFVLALLVTRAYGRRLGGAPSRLERWVVHEADDRRHRWARRLLLRSGWFGFGVASVALGPIVTTWLLYALGQRRDDVVSVALASSAIFAVTFVGPYVGLGRLLFGG